MPDDALVLMIGVGIGATFVIVLLLARRLGQGTRDLGSREERATFRTLHMARKAASDLRKPAVADLERAARHARTLLGAAVVGLGGPDGGIAFDGPAGGLEEAAEKIADQLRSARRRQIYPRRRGTFEGFGAVGAPIMVDGVVWGVVIAFAATVRAPLVRAVGEVAEWFAGQIALGQLDSSRSALAEAEVRALRAQISPHFIYNSLTAISSYITTDAPRARELVLEFADFTRYSFRRHGEFTTLADELRAVHSYVELERARFGDRLTVRLRIAPETLTTVMPYLALQPLVENAVKHGLEPGIHGGSLTIASEDLGAHTEITVEDNGVGMDPELARDLLTNMESNHVGLRNVDVRLRRHYGQGIVIETAPGAGTLVRIRIPHSQPKHQLGADG